ncbi:hypothetical protein [Streptomyces sp. TS71-3]|uniref:hypothetical protein n=1 Tax=Streptomyces sp. TS71-3 TaxID=2733862 RepID=UPI001B228345|nr:hypothetical protein [Streptomyces sp. TS71-3]GHJ38547.1 hypothetical protein Sm713_41560 [Streptomyces sp. TS71-3]
MEAHPHTTPHRGVEVRLPWWAVALPALAFAALLLVMINPSHARTSGDPALGRVLQGIQHSVLHQS